MTTTITVRSHNYPALVEVFDNGAKTSFQVLTPEDGTQTFHCTTSRQVRIVDIDYNDPLVPKKE